MSNWDVCRIDDLGTVNRGKSKHRPRNDSILFGGSYPFIQTADVKKANLYITEYDTTYSDIGLAQSKLWDKGTLCITIAANIAESAILGIDACFPDSVVGFIPHKGKADLKFVKYLLDEFKVYMQQISKGTTQDNLSLDKLRRVKFNVPDYETQVKIANTLSTYDDLIENNNKRIKLLEQMAENLYKEWFVRFRFPCYESAEFENGIPKGWEIYQAQNLFNISIGRTPDRKQFDFFTTNKDDVLWVSISDMKDNMFITKSSEYLTDEAIKKVNMPMVEEGTVLLSFKLSVGRVSITTKLSCTNEAIAHFKTNEKELLEYTYLYLKLFNYQNLGNTSAIGNAVNSTIIKKMKFLLPNRELIQKFHNCTKDIFVQIKNVMNENENLIKQRDLLLPRLMSGKLEV